MPGAPNSTTVCGTSSVTLTRAGGTCASIGAIGRRSAFAGRAPNTGPASRRASPARCRRPRQSSPCRAQAPAWRRRADRRPKSSARSPWCRSAARRRDGCRTRSRRSGGWRCRSGWCSAGAASPSPGRGRAPAARHRSAAGSAPAAAGRTLRRDAPSASAAIRADTRAKSLKLSSMARRSSRSRNAFASSSPAPSSSRPATMLATPGLSAGSCVEPPAKAYSMAMIGTVASCTSQASMPPGETTRWMLVACAAPSGSSRLKAAARPRRRASAGECERHERLSSRFAVVSLIR